MMSSVWEKMYIKTNCYAVHSLENLPAYFHFTWKAPVPVESLKFNNLVPGRYLVRWTLGNTKCCMMWCSGGLVNSVSKFLIGEPISNSRSVRYINLRQMLLGMVRHYIFFPSYVLNSKICIAKHSLSLPPTTNNILQSKIFYKLKRAGKP